MSDDDPWTDAPLSIAIENYIGSSVNITSHSNWSQIRANLEYGSHPSRKFTQQSCFSRWNAICLVSLDETHRQAFQKTLSRAQSHSLRLLFEWLEDGICQGPDAVAATVAFLAVDSLRVVPEEVIQRESRILFASHYQKTMLKLWTTELTRWIKPAGRSICPHGLPSERSRASVAAYVQRLGATVYGTIWKGLKVRVEAEACAAAGDGGQDNDGSGLSADATTSLSTDFVSILEMTSDPGHATIQEPGLRGRVVLKEARNIIDTKWRRDLGQENAVAQCLSLTRSEDESPKLHSPVWELEVTVNFCPWLTSAEKAGSPPQYLWDVEQRRTVDTGSFKHNPDYIAVSHTWGRWRMEDQPSVGVAGVMWPVPQNTRFDVSQIPDILGTIGKRLSCRHVWLDLVCIPQVSESCHESNWGEIKKREIGRQATIFSSARRAVAWLNDIISFEGIKEAAQWKAIDLLEFPLADPAYDQAIRKAAWLNASRFPHKFWDNLSGPSIRNLNGWLSSLWTLQEVCLRPDMYLCTRDWTFLSLDGITPLRMDRLVALFASERPRRAQKMSHHSQKDPKIASSISLALNGSGLLEINHISPLSILFQGDRRYCKHSRAQAVMSVIGAVKWHRDWDGNEDGSKLVLEKYPLSFVTEVRDKLGALFFAMRCQDGIRPRPNMLLSGYMQNLLTGVGDRVTELWLGFRQMKPAARGSLMPFGYSDVVNRLPMDFENANVKGHSSVETWKVHVDGSVAIQDAVVLSSPPRAQSPSRGIDVTLWWGHDSFDGDLHKWIRSQWSPCFAILLFCEEMQSPKGQVRWVAGIIIKRITGIYHICVGSFHSMIQMTKDWVVPAAETLNWVVL